MATNIRLLLIGIALIVIGGIIGFLTAKKFYNVTDQLKVSDSLLTVIAVKTEMFDKWMSGSDRKVSGYYKNLERNKKDYENDIDIDFTIAQLDSILRSTESNLKQGGLPDDSPEMR